MKKLFFSLALSLLTGVSANSQVLLTDTGSDSLFIYKSVDEFTNKAMLFPNQKIVGLTSGKGFSLHVYIEEDFKVKSMVIKMSKIGGCVENNEVIFLFEDATQLSLKSWNKFNCDGRAYFELTKKGFEQLKSNSIKKIRVINGYSHDSYTHECSENDATYFIRIFQLCDKKESVTFEQK